MIRKLAIVICLVTGAAGLWFRFDGVTRRRIHPERHCVTSMRTLEGALEMYDMDSTGVLFDHDGPASEFAERLVKGRYLKAFPVCKYGQGTYHLTGTPDRIEISCALHGTVKDYRFDRTICDWSGKKKDFLEALSTGDWEGAERFVAGGADVNAGNRDGCTLLHWAAFRNLPKAGIWLLSKGADLSARENSEIGATPIHMAAIYRSREFLEAVLTPSAAGNNGAGGAGPRKTGNPVNLRDRDGQTALHYLAKNTGGDSQGLGEFLMSMGAAVDAVDEKGRTPLHYAARNHTEDNCRFLLAGGARVDARDRDGRTPLHHSAEVYREKIISLLLSAGADSDATDKDGKTPGELTPISALIEVKNGKETIVKRRRPLVMTEETASIGKTAPIGEAASTGGESE